MSRARAFDSASSWRATLPSPETGRCGRYVCVWQVCVCVAGMCVCGRYMPASVGLLSLSMYIVGLFYLALGLFTQCTLTSDRYPCSSFVLLCFVLFPCSHCNVCSTPVTPFSKRGPCIDALRVASTVVSSSSSEAEVERDTMQPEMHHLHTRMGLHPQP